MTKKTNQEWLREMYPVGHKTGDRLRKIADVLDKYDRVVDAYDDPYSDERDVCTEVGYITGRIKVEDIGIKK